MNNKQSNNLKNLDWLDDFVNELPNFSAQKKKNILEICGFPNDELVNSNLLAFYFDENEEHQFGRLFINSLIEICEDVQKATKVAMDIATYMIFTFVLKILQRLVIRKTYKKS